MVEYAKHPATGDTVVMDGDQVQMRNAAGTIVQIHTDNFIRSLSEGLMPATADEVRTYDLRKRESGIAATAKTLGENIAVGAADVATAGYRAADAVTREAMVAAVQPFSPELSQEIGDVPPPPWALPTGREAAAATIEALGGNRAAYEQEAREAAQASPTAAGVGQVVGGVLASGGLVGPAGGVVARVGVEAGVGAGFGLQAVGEDAFIRNEKLSSQKALAAMGLGAILGGGVAFGIAGSSRLFRRSGSRGATPFDSPRAGSGGAYRSAAKADEYEALVSQAAGAPPAPGVAAKLRDAVEGLQSAATGAKRETLQRYGALRWDSTALSGREMWRNRDQILEGATRDLAGNIDSLARNSRDVFDDVVDVRLKRSNISGKLTGDRAVMLDAARRETGRLRAELQAIALDAEQYGNARLVKNTRKLVNDLARETRATDDAAQAFIALDRTKRALQRERVALGRSAARQPDALLSQQARALGDRLEELQAGTRATLTDESVWGAAAVDQRTINAAWEEWFESKRLFDGHFLARTGETFDGRPIMAADPNKVNGFVRKLGRQESALVDEHFRHHVMATNKLSEAISEAFDLQQKKAAVDAVRSSAEEITRTLAKADETVKVANQIDAVISSEGSAGLPSALLGGALGGPLGALAGAAYGIATRPGSLIKSMAALESLGANVDGRILKSIRRAISAVPDLPSGAAPKRLPVKRAAVSATLRELTEDDSDRHDTYRRRVTDLAEITTSPGLASQRLREATSSLAADAPKMAGLIGIQALRGAQFLQTKVPAAVVHANGFGQRFDETEASDEEISRFNLYWHAVNNPLSVLDDMENGMLMEEQVEALQAVYPDMLQDIRRRALIELSDKKDPLPYDMRAQLDLLLDFGGAGEPSYAPAFIDRWSQLAEMSQPDEPPPPRRGGGGGTKLAEKMQTQSASIEARS